ncbi:hypothetical protein AQ621_05985 [Marinobacter sp. P4B1]|nr:hypothetical protein AQ621_05985 [Marinobacter sp. P4B1]
MVRRLADYRCPVPIPPVIRGLFLVQVVEIQTLTLTALKSAFRTRMEARLTTFGSTMGKAINSMARILTVLPMIVLLQRSLMKEARRVS